MKRTTLNNYNSGKKHSEKGKLENVIIEKENLGNDNSDKDNFEQFQFRQGTSEHSKYGRIGKGNSEE